MDKATSVSDKGENVSIISDASFGESWKLKQKKKGKLLRRIPFTVDIKLSSNDMLHNIWVSFLCDKTRVQNGP